MIYPPCLVLRGVNQYDIKTAMIGTIVKGTTARLWAAFLLGYSIFCAAEFSFAQLELLHVPLESKNPEVADGVHAALKGDNKTAEKHFAEALKKNPGSRPGGIDASMAFADPEFEQQHFGKLRFWLEKTAEDFPDDPESFLLLAKIALSEQRRVESFLLTEHAVQLLDHLNGEPDRKKTLEIQAVSLRADIAEDREQWMRATEYLKYLIELDPENANHLYRLGLAQFRGGDRESAIRSLTEAETKNERILPPLVVLAQLAEFDGNREESQKILAEALEQGGEDVRVLLAAADLELLWNHPDKVRQYAEKAQQIDPDSADAETMLGISDLYAGDYPAAEARFARVFESLPNDFKAMTGLALALCEQEDLRKLRRAFILAKQNADNHPRSIDSLTTLAWVLIKAGNLDEAEKILTRQFESGQMNSPGAYYLAVVYAQQNRKKDAIIFLKSSLENNVNFPKRTAAESLLRELTEKKTPEKPEEP